MRASTWVRNILRSERGNVLAIAAATMPLMVGAAAVGIDTIQLSLWKRQLQRMADSAALAGGHAIAQGRPASAAATSDLARNNLVTLLNPASIQNAPATGAFANNMRAVRVELTARRHLPFWRFFQGESPTLTVESTALFDRIARACLISLEDGAATGINVTGSASVRVNCGASTNAQGDAALVVSGSATITATPLMAVGNIPVSSNIPSTTQVIPYADAQADPWANLGNPVIPTGGCPAADVGPQDTVTLDPGCYAGMDLKGTVTLRPGTYYIDGGTFSAGSQANITGAGVTIVLTSSNAVSNPGSVASLNINGGANLNLTAPTPTSGQPYPDILIYQDRRAELLNDIRINGNSSGRLEGTIYMPRAEITMNGSSGSATQCLQLIARRLSFSGNTEITNNCNNNTGPNYWVSRVRLVA